MEPRHEPNTPIIPPAVSHLPALQPVIKDLQLELFFPPSTKGTPSYELSLSLKDRTQVIITTSENDPEKEIRHVILTFESSAGKSYEQAIDFPKPIKLKKVIDILYKSKDTDVRSFAVNVSENFISTEHSTFTTQDGKLKVLGDSLKFLWKHRFHPTVIGQMFRDLYFIKNSPECISTALFDQGRINKVPTYIYKNLAGAYTVALWSAFSIASVVGHQVQTMFASSSVGLIATAATDYVIQTGIFVGIWVGSNSKYYFSKPVTINNQAVNPSTKRWKTLGHMIRSDLKVCSAIYLGNLGVCKLLSLVPGFESSITYTSQFINLAMYGTFALKNIVACTKLFKTDFKLDLTSRICSEGLPEKINKIPKIIGRATRNVGVVGIGFFVFERFIEWGTIISQNVGNAHSMLSAIFLGACGFWALTDMSDYKKRLIATINKK